MDPRVKPAGDTVVVDIARQFGDFLFPQRIHTPIRITLLFSSRPCTNAMPCSVEGVVDRDARRLSQARPPTTRSAMERREAPGLPRKRPARHGTPTPSNTWVPEARRVRPADRKAGLREPIARLPGRLPALHSPLIGGERKTGDGRTWASEKTKPRDSGALAETLNHWQTIR